MMSAEMLRFRIFDRIFKTFTAGRFFLTRACITRVYTYYQSPGIRALCWFTTERPIYNHICVKTCTLHYSEIKLI